MSFLFYLALVVLAVPILEFGRRFSSSASKDLSFWDEFGCEHKDVKFVYGEGAEEPSLFINKKRKRALRRKIAGLLLICCAIMLIATALAAFILYG